LSNLSDELAKNGKEISKMTTATEKALVSNYRQGLMNIRIKLVTIYDKYGTEGKLTYAEMTRYNRLRTLHKELESELIALTGRNGRATKILAADAYEESFFRYGYAIEKVAGVNLKWGILKREVIQQSVQNPISGLTLNETLVKNRAGIVLKIRQEVTQGLIQGESYFKMAGRIKDTLGKDAVKAMRVARTEAHRNQVAGELDSLDHVESEGVILKRFWIATLDGDTRDTHASADGQVADEDGLFTVGGVKTRGPGQSGVAAEDINCRCDVGTEVEDIKPSVRRIKGEGVKKNITYDEWKKQKGKVA
jgi:hypothetical protein